MDFWFFEFCEPEFDFFRDGGGAAGEDWVAPLLLAITQEYVGDIVEQYGDFLEEYRMTGLEEYHTVFCQNDDNHLQVGRRELRRVHDTLIPRALLT